MALVYGALVIRRYDLLARMLASVHRGIVRPDRYVIVDNGAQPEQVLRAVEAARISDRAHVLLQNRNLGVSAGFNLILDSVEKDDLLVVGNDDLALGDQVLEVVRESLAEADLVLAPGFLLFGLRPGVFLERVGFFDENLYPAYFEDCDVHRRANLADIRINPRPPVQHREAADFDEVPYGNIVRHEGSASLRALSMTQQQAFSRRFVELSHYYGRKWGGGPGKEVHTQPFNGDAPPGWHLRPVTVGGEVPDEPWLRA